MISNDIIMRTYRRMSKVVNPDAIFIIDKTPYTIVEMPFVVETLIGRYEVSYVSNTIDFEEYIDDFISDSMDLKDAIVNLVIKPDYEYVPSGLVDMLVNKSRKSISCGSTWPQIVAFVRKQMVEHNIGKKVIE